MEAGEEMAGPVLAEATEGPRQGLSARLKPRPRPLLWDRPTRRWTPERSLLQNLLKGFPSPGAPARAQRKGDTTTLCCSICGSRSLVHLILLKPFLAALGLQFQDSWGQVQVNGRGGHRRFQGASQVFLVPNKEAPSVPTLQEAPLAQKASQS